MDTALTVFLEEGTLTKFTRLINLQQRKGFTFKSEKIYQNFIYYLVEAVRNHARDVFNASNFKVLKSMLWKLIKHIGKNNLYLKKLLFVLTHSKWWQPLVEVEVLKQQSFLFMLSFETHWGALSLTADVCAEGASVGRDRVLDTCVMLFKDQNWPLISHSISQIIDWRMNYELAEKEAFITKLDQWAR